MKNRFKARSLSILVTGLLPMIASASYTEELKQELQEEATPRAVEGETLSYTQRQKEKLLKEDAKLSDEERAELTGSVIESVRSDEEASSTVKSRRDSRGYTQREKERLQAMEDTRKKSAIESFKSGKDELKPRKKGEISRAGGFLIGPSLTHTVDVSGGKTNADFESLYTEVVIPDLGFSYEFEIFRNRWLGSLALGGEVTGAIFKGAGQFSNTSLVNEITDEPFSSASKVDFQFLILPAVATVTYRLNWGEEVFQPFIGVGYGATFYQESRDDTASNHYGYSPVSKFTAGLNVSMDWLFDQSSWGLYEEFKIQKFYLSLAYSQWTTLSGTVDFSTNGYLAGMSYEF